MTENLTRDNEGGKPAKVDASPSDFLESTPDTFSTGKRAIAQILGTFYIKRQKRVEKQRQ